MKKLWFKNKEYGWGWYPASWEGWAVLAIWLVVLAAITSRAASLQSADQVIWQMSVPVFILTAILLIICWKTGEKPEWRWGGKPIGKQKQDNLDTH